MELQNLLRFWEDMFSSESLFLFCVHSLMSVNFVTSPQKHLIVLGSIYLCLGHHTFVVSFESLI